MMKKIRLFLFLTISFVLLIITGYFANEYVKILTAKSLGYENTFIPGLGRNLFDSDSLQEKIFQNKEQYTKKDSTTQEYKNDPNWKSLTNSYNRGFSLIALSGYLFTSFISLFGLLFWRYRRKKNVPIIWFDWTLLILSLFVLREVIFFSFNLLFQSFPCVEFAFFNYLGISNKIIFNLHYFLIFTGIVYLSLILLKVVPKGNRLQFFFAGFLGFIVSIYLILFFLVRYLF